MNNIINWLLKPFKNDFSYFLLVLILITSIDIYDFSKRGLIPYTIYLFFYGYVITYLLYLMINTLPSKLTSISKIIIIIISTLLFIADILSLYIYEQKFTTDFLTIFIQTNISEAKEFIETYISLSFVSIIFLLLFSLLSSYYWSKKHIRLKNNIIYLAFIGVVAGGIMIIRNPMTYKDSFIGRVLELKLTSIPINIPNLKKYEIQPQLSILKKQQPQNIVILIGESFSKSHSSLYGYSKQTNPRLTTITDSLLFIYKNVTSAAQGTFASIKCIMSTYKPEYKDSIEWYKCITLPKTMQTAGYQTFWISNQSKIGLFDTGVGRYADLCDYQHFVGDKFAGMNRINFKDEAIIDILHPILQDTINNNIYFIQLMGSHQNFKHRYPNTFEIFKKGDYLNFPEHQRENLANYDNSILYNDSVVYEIMDLFQDKEAIIFYLSDHAIDVYESSDRFIGHAKGTDPKSVEAGSKIPFMIYTSPLYQQNFPNEMEQIKRCTEQPFRTDDMIYTIMDIIGVTFKGESLEGKSIFQLSSNKNN